MPKYLFQASYTREGVNGLLQDGGSKRAEVIGNTVTSSGGTLESLYFAFGDSDLLFIAELPDDETATAISLNISAGGGLGVSTTVLVEPATLDAAAAKDVQYTPPGA